LSRSSLNAIHTGLQEAQKNLTQQKDKIETLEQTLFELRGEIGAGNHVPPGMRVLCLRDNPAQQWTDLRQSVMDRLKSENEALIKRLRELESSGAVAADGGVLRHDLVPRESWEVLDKEKKELEEVVKQKEKRLLRLQQVRITFARFFAVIDGRPSLWFGRYSPQKALSSEKP
jgi:mitotic spindle assembly checkpoint protein MAD1